MIQQTSLDAYISVDLSKMQKKIYYFFFIYNELTNIELSQKSGIPINSVTPRVLELRKKGLIKKKCKVITTSGRKAILWYRFPMEHMEN